MVKKSVKRVRRTGPRLSGIAVLEMDGFRLISGSRGQRATQAAIISTYSLPVRQIDRFRRDCAELNHGFRVSRRHKVEEYLLHPVH